MHIFIDTNILLGFYEMSGDSLVELEKIVSVFKSTDAHLWLPDQVKREFWKNREGSVVKSLKDLEKASALAGGAPVLVQNTSNIKTFSKNQRQSIS